MELTPFRIGKNPEILVNFNNNFVLSYFLLLKYRKDKNLDVKQIKKIEKDFHKKIKQDIYGKMLKKVDNVLQLDLYISFFSLQKGEVNRKNDIIFLYFPNPDDFFRELKENQKDTGDTCFVDYNIVLKDLCFYISQNSDSFFTKTIQITFDDVNEYTLFELPPLVSLYFETNTHLVEFNYNEDDIDYFSDYYIKSINLEKIIAETRKHKEIEGFELVTFLKNDNVLTPIVFYSYNNRHHHGDLVRSKNVVSIPTIFALRSNPSSMLYYHYFNPIVKKFYEKKFILNSELYKKNVLLENDSKKKEEKRDIEHNNIKNKGNDKIIKTEIKDNEEDNISEDKDKKDAEEILNMF